MRENGTLRVKRIELQHRKRLAPGTDGPPLRGPVQPSELAPREIYSPPLSSHETRRWAYAKRAFLCQLAMAGELDMHLGGAHLVTEQLMAALVTTSRMPRTQRDTPDIRCGRSCFRICARRSASMAFGDLLIVGEEGVLAQSTALTAESVVLRFRHALGARDWKGFSPRHPIGDQHH